MAHTVPHARSAYGADALTVERSLATSPIVEVPSMIPPDVFPPYSAAWSHTRSMTHPRTTTPIVPALPLGKRRQRTRGHRRRTPSSEVCTTPTDARTATISFRQASQPVPACGENQYVNEKCANRRGTKRDIERIRSPSSHPSVFLQAGCER